MRSSYCPFLKNVRLQFELFNSYLRCSALNRYISGDAKAEIGDCEPTLIAGNASLNLKITAHADEENNSDAIMELADVLASVLKHSPMFSIAIIDPELSRGRSQ